MEMIQKSPAAAIIRLEDKIESMVTKTKFREKAAQIESAVTRNTYLLKSLIALYLSGTAIVGAIFAKIFFF